MNEPSNGSPSTNKEVSRQSNPPANSIMRRSSSGKCLSDSVLDSYKRSRSNEAVSRSQTMSRLRRNGSSSFDTLSLSNSGWTSNASFNIVQRSAAAKGEICDSIAKINECINIMNTQQQHTQQTQQYQQQPTNNHFNALCAEQVRQNVATLASFVQDDYYRIIAGNNNGIEIIIAAMNVFPLHETLIATSNLTLGIICQNSAIYQRKLMDAANNNGLNIIIQSIRNFPTSEKVCSTAVDALSYITTNNACAMIYLSQIPDFELLLQNTNNYIYPLSKQNKDILLENLQSLQR